MAAKLNLSPRGIFDITLEDGTVISGKFGTWALKKFSDNNGNEEISKKLQTVPGFIDYLLYAVEYLSRKNKTAFSYTDIDACDWIDQLGGLNGALTVKLMTHNSSDAEVEEEKKTLAE